MVSDIFQVTFLVGLLTGMVRIATPLLFASLGELITERSGVMNLGIEGIMLMGALTGFLTVFRTQSLWLGVMAAAICGGLLGLFVVFLSTTMMIDQKVTGLTLNLLSSGITVYVYRIIFKNVGSSDLPTIPIFNIVPIPALSGIPVIGKVLFSQHPLTYVIFILAPLIYLFLYRTKYGLKLRCLGHNPRALDMMGVNIHRYQFMAATFGGMMAAVGGAFLTLSSVAMFIPDIIGGRGWIAIALVIFGDWKPIRIVWAAFFFSLLDSFQLQIQGIGFEFPYQLLLAIPYLLTIVVLVVGRNLSGAPMGLGVSYTRE